MSIYTPLSSWQPQGPTPALSWPRDQAASLLRTGAEHCEENGVELITGRRVTDERRPRHVSDVLCELKLCGSGGRQEW